MSQMAVLMKKKGYLVSGSDALPPYPPASEFLNQHGIKPLIGYSKDNISNECGLVVVGNTVTRENPEAREVMARGLRYVSLPQLIKEMLIRNRKSFVISGTHGKTTTTAMLAWIFTDQGLDPGYFIGGIPKQLGIGAHDGKGRVAVVEGDEYDSAFFDKRPKFLHYSPRYLLINNLEFDHADIYPDLDHIVRTFESLVRIVPEDGVIVANADDEKVMSLAAKAICRKVTFGLSTSADWRVIDYKLSGSMTTAVILGPEGREENFSIALQGFHNVTNALAALVMAVEGAGIPFKKAAESIKRFQGVARRLELVLSKNGVYLYDDFAHHPTAVSATIHSLRQVHPSSRIWAIFEPRSNTMRRNILEDELANSLALADIVIIGKVYRSEMLREDERLNPERVIEKIRKKAGKTAVYAPGVEDIRKEVRSHLEEGDVMVILSNGAFDGLKNRLERLLNDL